MSPQASNVVFVQSGAVRQESLYGSLRERELKCVCCGFTCNTSLEKALEVADGRDHGEIHVFGGQAKIGAICKSALGESSAAAGTRPQPRAGVPLQNVPIMVLGDCIDVKMAR